MADTNTKHERKAPVAGNASHIILAIEDGTGKGHYVTVAPPAFDNSPAMQTALLVGIKYDLLRKAQSVAKKAAKDSKDVGAALADFASNPAAHLEADSERVETVAVRRGLIAGEMLKARLTELGKPASEANVAANLPAYVAKYGEKIDSALAAYLSAGYTPTKRDGSAAKGTEGGTVLAADDL